LKRFLSAALFALLASCLSVLAQDDTAQKGWSVVAECQIIVLPQAAAISLLPKLLDEQEIDSGYSKVLQLVANQQAQLIANLVVRARDKEKGIGRTTEELRCASHYEPPDLPWERSEEPGALKYWPLVGPSPFLFETHETGVTLHVEPSVRADGRLVEVAFAAEHVRLLRWEKVDCGKLPDGDRLFVETPIYHSIQDKAEFALVSGRRVLVGMHKLPGTPERIELHFFKARVLSNIAP
jgi:hypothetical protein